MIIMDHGCSAVYIDLFRRKDVNMPTDDLPVKDTAQETDALADNAEDTLAVPPPSFRERLKAAQRVKHIPDMFTPVRPPCKENSKIPPRKD
jgi:hypothetical protein